MKQLHKQSSLNHRRDEENQGSSSHVTSPYSNKTLKNSRTLPRSLSYLLKEQRLLFVLVGILIASSFFILQPTLTKLSPSESHFTRTFVPHIANRDEISDQYSGGGDVNPAFSGGFGTGVGNGGYSSSGGGFSGGDVNAGMGNYRSGKVERVPISIPGKRLRIVVTGGAGFVGSHLVDKLLGRGDSVIVIDNFFTGRKENVMHHFGNPRFELIRHDVVEPILLEVDQIYHLACPASPVHYKFNPIKTIKTNVMGTLNMLGLAKRIGARFLLTSTSEVYGDPLEHPQKETYWGNVNPIGVRSCYDEGKRTAETLAMDYHRGAGVEVRIARIFNTYGPRMCIDDGRVVSNFVAQALRKQPLTVYGDGKQTRSFQYVADLVDGLVALMEGDHVGPFNLGNPGEFTMLELAEVVKQTIDSSATVEFKPNTADDPHMRKPDITKAKELLNWEPKISLNEGLPRMVTDFQKRIDEETQRL
ncbi:UDP-glucuronic acid decarboxylase 1-like [Papaver somniferum]|uniref:UDP-glucuronic acid decarboxylase 1-like n=1 Tax=Papaver somniferum TaxID=3469 RepID=UPI000E703C29|nr:UDP-glucuronic acid decarboxylase 1-like [Papaver somniferum]